MHTFIHILHTCIFHLYLTEYDPQTAKRRVRERFSDVHTRELNKHYPNYFNLTPEARRSLATSLGITVASLRNWMNRKHAKEKASKITKDQLLTYHKQEHGIHVAGILLYTVDMYVYK